MLTITSKSIQKQESPICHITVGGVDLHGLMFDNCQTKTACLFIHGTGSNFYQNEWVYPLATMMNKNDIAFLSVNNRGSHGFSPYPPHGATMEKFNGCVDDINGWISHLKDEGYNRFILLGHSLGTEKIIHYMDQKKKAGHVVSVVLLGFSDSYHEQKDHWGSKFHTLMKEAKSLIDNEKSETFLSTEWFSHAGVLPKSAMSFVDFYSEDSDLSKALPFPNGKLTKYSRIRVPILGVIGDRDFEEWTAVTVNQAIDLMRSENTNSTIKKISNCDHDFTGKHDELCNIVDSFLKSKLQ